MLGQTQFRAEAFEIRAGRTVAGDFKSDAGKSSDDGFPRTEQVRDIFFRTEAGDRDDWAVVAWSPEGEARQVDAVPERLDPGGGDAFLDREAGTVLRDANKTLGE